MADRVHSRTQTRRRPRRNAGWFRLEEITPTAFGVAGDRYFVVRLRGNNGEQRRLPVLGTILFDLSAFREWIYSTTGGKPIWLEPGESWASVLSRTVRPQPRRALRRDRDMVSPCRGDGKKDSWLELIRTIASST